VKQRIEIYTNPGRMGTDDEKLEVNTLTAAAGGEAGSEHKFRLPGPYAELTGVLHLGKNEHARRNLLVMAHGFRGSMDGGGRAIELARRAQVYANVLRFNFSECQTLSAQVQEWVKWCASRRVSFVLINCFCWDEAWAERRRLRLRHGTQ